MKKLSRFYVLLLLVISVLACNTEEPAFFIYKENDFTIPAGLNVLETHFFVTSNIPNTFKAELESRGILPEQIKSVNAGEGLFTPVFNEFDYGYLDEVSIWMVSADNPSVRKEIYYREPIPLNQKNELKLLSGIANLKDFLLEEDRYNLEIQLNFRNFVPLNIDNRFTYNFAIFME